MKNRISCKNCIPHLGKFKASLKNYSKFTHFKCYKENCLFFVSSKAFDFFMKMVCIFRTYFSVVSVNIELDLHLFFVDKFSEVALDVPNCHEMKMKIIKRFSTFRLRIKSQKQKKNKHFSSKSMSMHHDVK